MTPHEGFFKRAFVLNDDKGLKELLAFLDDHPDDAAQAVSDGIALARKFRGQVDYNEHWPSAYGLTVTQCGLKKLKSRPPCPRTNGTPPSNRPLPRSRAITAKTAENGGAIPFLS